MGRGRVSAGALVILLGKLLLLLCTVIHPAQAGVYYVGGDLGWDYGAVKGWGDDKIFHANEIIVFRYNRFQHNVVEVDAVGYSTCKAGPASKVYTSGNDVFRLGRGTRYFISTFSGDCDYGMKVRIFSP